jgi:hypothetical protein
MVISGRGVQLVRVMPDCVKDETALLALAEVAAEFKRLFEGHPDRAAKTLFSPPVHSVWTSMP